MDGQDLYPAFAEALPEFAAIPESAVVFQLDLAVETLCERALGKWWQYAVFLRAAHYLALRYPVAAAAGEAGLNPGLVSSGTATSVSASTGGLSQSMSQTAMVSGDSAIEADFARTGYGLQYLSLLDQIIAPGQVVYSLPPHGLGRCC